MPPTGTSSAGFRLVGDEKVLVQKLMPPTLLKTSACTMGGVFGTGGVNCCVTRSPPPDCVPPLTLVGGFTPPCPSDGIAWNEYSYSGSPMWVSGAASTGRVADSSAARQVAARTDERF